MVRAVIFDVDGTLLDSVDLHAQAWQETFRHFGKEVSFDEVRHQIGKGGDQLVPHFFPPEELKDRQKAITEFRKDLFQRKYLSQVKPFPGVRDLLQRVRQEGQRTALASSATGEELETYQRILRIEDLVDEATSSKDAERSKPHPDIFHAALARLALPPREAIAVGDTPYDAEAARKADLQILGVLSGGFPEKELRDAGCMEIYRDPEDLLARYGSSPLVG